MLAVSERFELSDPVRGRHLSKVVQSATLPTHYMVEAVRFELTDPLESLVFKTRAIDHSTTLPYPVTRIFTQLTYRFSRVPTIFLKDSLGLSRMREFKLPYTSTGVSCSRIGH